MIGSTKKDRHWGQSRFSSQRLVPNGTAMSSNAAWVRSFIFDTANGINQVRSFKFDTCVFYFVTSAFSISIRHFNQPSDFFTCFKHSLQVQYRPRKQNLCYQNHTYPWILVREYSKIKIPGKRQTMYSLFIITRTKDCKDQKGHIACVSLSKH